ncbi:MAG: HPr(Ser) kinase/phosphatase [Elusimicrobia bacterium]|nr:HPr(Ser) kinase/phosphatase [Elusimicrobiota bacterium]
MPQFETAIPSLSVGEFFKEQKQRLKLELIAGKGSLNRKITIPEVNRPGLSLSGFLEHFRAERIQIIGHGEQAYCLRAEPKRLFATLSKMLSHKDLPCLVTTRNLSIPQPIVRACRRFGVPLLRTRFDTAVFIGELAAYLENRLSPVSRVHGVLVDVYGLGVLIQGDSGIGKSECALELLKRGHILVADDVVEIQKRHGGMLVGRCPDNLRHHMEVRGLGILDVKLLFGIGSILDQTRIELSVHLELWNQVSNYERAGLEMLATRIMGVEIPDVRIPVSPGRNLAILIEVAALNQRLRSQGYFSAQTFNQTLIDKMRHASSARRALEGPR